MAAMKIPKRADKRAPSLESMGALDALVGAAAVGVTVGAVAVGVSIGAVAVEGEASPAETGSERI